MSSLAMLRRFALLALGASVALCACAPPPEPPEPGPGKASIAIGRVYAGRLADPGDDFVSVVASPQNQVSDGLVLTVHDATGAVLHAVDARNDFFMGSSLTGALVFASTSAAELRGLVTHTEATLDLEGSGGALCIGREDTQLDCVQWGDYAGDERGHSAPNAPSMELGDQLRRITDDELAYVVDDDTDNSARDFGIFRDTFADAP